MWFWLMFEKGFFRTMIFGAFIFISIAFLYGILSPVFEVVGTSLGTTFSFLGLDSPEFASLAIGVGKVLTILSLWDVYFGMLEISAGIKILIFGFTTIIAFLSLFVVPLFIGILFDDSVFFKKLVKKLEKMLGFRKLGNFLYIVFFGVVYFNIFILVIRTIFKLFSLVFF